MICILYGAHCAHWATSSIPDWVSRNFYRRITALTTLIFIVSTVLLAQQRGASSVGPDHPLWKVDLRSADLAKQPNLYESPLAFGFVGSDKLVVAWFVSHPAPLPGSVESATLKAVYVNANTGKLQSNSEWMATSRPLAVHITPSGHLLVRTGQTLRVFSPELKPLQEQEFSTPAVFGLTVSPDGARAMVCPASRDPSAAQMLNTDTLQVLDTVPTIVRCGDYFLGNKSILALRSKDSEVFVRTSGEPWHALSPLSPTSGMGRTRDVRFLNDSVIAVNSGYCSHSFSIQTIEGKTLSIVKLPEGRCWGGIITTSPGGQYFGVPEERLRGIKNETLDMYPFPSPEQFVVYRLPDIERIFRVKVEGISPWFPKQLVQKYALSPDGGRVAVMSNGVIRAYAVQ